MITIEGQRVGSVPETMPAAEAILDILRLNGVRTIFSSPGSEWPAVWDALARPPQPGERALRYLNTRHESLAVAMAAGYHKATGELPAVFLHSSVGPLQGAMPLQMADREQTPMVVFSGDSITWGEDPNLDPGPQWLRSLAERGGAARLIGQVVKWADMVPGQEALCGMVEQACRAAISPPRGPAYVSVPMERMMGTVAGALLPRSRLPLPRVLPDPMALDEAAAALATARAPVIITEEGGRDPANVARLVELAELLGAPVAEAQTMGYMNFPSEHPLHAGYATAPVLRDADVIFLAAARGPWHPPSKGPADATIILADENPEKLHYPLWPYRVDTYAAGALDATLDGLLARLRERRLDADAVARRTAHWAERHAAQRAQWDGEAESLRDQSPIDARWAAYALGRELPADATVVEETTTTRAFIQRHVRRTLAGRYFARMTAGLGIGLSAACGVKVARPDEVVMAVLGDGAFNYNPVLAALGFQLEYGLPIINVVFNNQSYASMKGGIEKFYPEGWSAQTGTYHGAGIAPPPDYAQLGPLVGGVGEKVTDPGQVGPAMARAVAAVRNGQPAVLDIHIGPSNERG
jgi:thiamine pyrophosphate-dependent acetolactate synthase large subunit-like protein